MKFSLEWLKKFINVKNDAHQIAAQITDGGLEVESIVDNVIEVSVPPNRADCLGMVGLSREIAAIMGDLFIEPVIKPITATCHDQVKIQVQDSVSCPKYLGRVIRGIDNTKETPQWMRECLINADMKIISPVVDITNYVLLEWGQPLHAFDLTKISGDIIVRKARNGEQMQLLDESTVQLTSQTLLIADSKQPLAIAGVKGGMDSGITLNTKDILLECAYFEPVGVRLTSRHFGLKTDGAYRFERCIDPAMQEKVMERATQLILDLVGGSAGPVVSVVDKKQLPNTVSLSLRISRIKKILGVHLDKVEVSKILQRLGFQVESYNSNDELMVTVPAFRQDISREIDLVEEVGRIYGFQNIPAQSTVSTLEFMPLPEALVTEHQILKCLVNRGYHEVITYSFIDQEYAKLFNSSINAELCLTNPISSEMGYMRPSLLPGLIKTVQYNQNRQQDRIRLFEVGLRYTGTMQNLQQRKTIAGVCYGNILPEAWGNQKRATDLFDVKGDVLALIKLAHNAANLQFKHGADPAMHPGQCLDILLNGETVGMIGAMHPSLQETLALPETVIMFEIDYAAISNGNIASFTMFAKYPSVRRDLAILVNRKLNAAQLESAIRAKAGSLLTELVLFDVYHGKNIPADQKSMALGLTLQHPDRTLTETEVNEVFTSVISMLQHEYSATLR